MRESLRHDMRQMLLPRMMLTRAGRYQTPKPVRYAPLIWTVLMLVIAGVGIAQAARGGLHSPVGSWATVCFVVLLWGAALSFQFRDAPRYVLAVEWDEREVVLHTRRGMAQTYAWPSIARAKVPRGRYDSPAELSHKWGGGYTVVAHVFTLESDRPYVIPLFDEYPACRAFLTALESRTAVVRLGKGDVG